MKNIKVFIKVGKTYININIFKYTIYYNHGEIHLSIENTFYLLSTINQCENAFNLLRVCKNSALSTNCIITLY